MMLLLYIKLCIIDINISTHTHGTMIENWHILATFCTIWTFLLVAGIRAIANLFFEDTSADTHTHGYRPGYTRPDQLTKKNPELAWDRVKDKIAKQFLDKTMKDLKQGSMFEGELPEGMEGMEGILGEVITLAKDNPEMVKEFLEGFRKGKSDEVQDEAFM